VLLRASISAVVRGAPLAERAALAASVVGVVVCEGVLIVVAKHLFSSHVAHYVGGRMSTLVVRKVARLGARPAGAEETQFVGADLPQVPHLACAAVVLASLWWWLIDVGLGQVVELVRIVAFLPSGVVSLFCGLVVLLFYLGLSGAVGLFVLGGIFVANVKVWHRCLLERLRERERER
jgi:hypothetical protein